VPQDRSFGSISGASARGTHDRVEVEAQLGHDAVVGAKGGGGDDPVDGRPANAANTTTPLALSVRR
jgi:hypothetical protein